MLGKLIKHDIKEMANWYLPLYLLYAGIAVAFIIMLQIVIRNPALTENEDALFGNVFGALTIAFILAVVALLLLNILITVYYFYRKFVSEEAYLTMTLPVEPWEHILSKMLSSAVWQLITWILFILSMGLLLLTSGAAEELALGVDEQLTLKTVWIQVSHEIGLNIGSIFLGIVYGILSFITSPLKYYASISLGQLFQKRKVLMAVVAYVAISIATATVTSSSMLGLFTDSLVGILAISIVEVLIASVVYFAISVYFLGKRLNLE